MLLRQQGYDGQSWVSMDKCLVVEACTRRH